MPGEITVGMKYGTYDEKMFELKHRVYELNRQGVYGTSVHHYENTDDNGVKHTCYSLVTQKGFGYGAPKLPNGTEDNTHMTIFTYADSRYNTTAYESFEGFRHTCMDENGKFNSIVSPDGKHTAYDHNGDGIVNENEIDFKFSK